MADPTHVVLREPSSELSAVYVPGAGMIATSLSDGGTELLGQRRGLEAYLSAGKTMGIPLLFPWANRLSAKTYVVDGDTVALAPDAYGVRPDNNGLPIHGLLAAYPGWQPERDSDQKLTAELDFGARPELLESFPFPHLLGITVELRDRTLTVTTTVTPTADKAVPLVYGYHPYLQLAGVPRAEWQIETPTMRHLAVDDTGIPTGATADWPATAERLGDRVFDDGFDQVDDGAVFAVSGGGRRLEVRFEQGYPAAQIFAPASEPVICFEPMAAPTDALRRGGYRSAKPGEPDTTVFSINVS
ncbi:aldose 1-epimerase [Mycolicibacterium moriokaense]|uniref:Galactose mutarotase-like enzyme n=1 Tax=Mycolicibacterium moriokaense TaxID=39691 RepID=A0A318HIW9_9MYCO|nr:aldose 1-epimerase [Mycolicibacterium moriokaense]PXX05570.1 galactose mutarotase-like enzyme [Mycolicibacterium moriokaense]